MKKLISVFLVIALMCGALASCIPGISTTTSTTSTSSTTSTNKGSTTTTTTTNKGGTQDPPKDDPVVQGEIEVTLADCSFETIFIEWLPYDGADSYEVVCDGVSVDRELIRSYGSYYRCDVLGLVGDREYTVEIVPMSGCEVMTEAITTVKATPIPHVREGFAFKGGTASGAYNDDGTLREGARVIYITNENKDTVTLRVQTGKSSYTDAVGLQNILLALKKGYETKPVCIRFIGNITDPAVLEKGDLLVDLGNTKFTGGITLEGVGNDATFNGFGLRIKSATNVEVRNLGFMNCDSNEGDSISLQQDNYHVWVHNCDLFYGQAGSDADQDKGDGALDVKTSSYITLSFNHFYDTGKSNLQGMKSESTENYVTYHHNWYDHSDSRHPRVRTCTVHVYNNFYDGVSKYGIGATMGSSIFVENNYFLNTKYPMLSSLQGQDGGTFSGESGGIIKAFGNEIIGGKGIITHLTNPTSFDCYLATSRDEKIPSSIKTLVGGTTYNNFDTNSSVMYEYSVESAENAVNTVKQYAGRIQGGDFKWTFDDSDNDSYAVDPELKAALLAYECKLVSVGGGQTENGGAGNEGEGADPNPNPDPDPNPNPDPNPIPEGTVVHSFEQSGLVSDFFTITGNLSTGKGSVNYGGMTLNTCLKMESSTSISFTLESEKTLTLVFKEAGKIVKIDGEKHTSDASGTVVITLSAGTHTVSKGDVMNLFCIVLE